MRKWLRFQVSLGALVLLTVAAGAANQAWMRRGGGEWVHEKTFVTAPTPKGGSVLGMSSHAALSPDSRRLVGTADGWLVSCFDVDSGERQWSINVGADDTMPLQSFCFSDDGAFIIGGTKKKFMRFFDTAMGERVPNVEPSKSEQSVILSAHSCGESHAPDGTRFVERTYIAPNLLGWKLWDTSKPMRELVADIQATNTFVFGAAFSPDSRRVAFGSYDYIVRVHDARDGKELTTFKTDAWVLGVRFSNDGERLVVAHPRKVSLWKRTRPEWKYGLHEQTETWIAVVALLAAIILAVVHARAARRTTALPASAPTTPASGTS